MAVMSGVLLTGHGGPEMLVWSDEIPLPEPAPGEVRIRVGASAVNNTDINTRVGWYSKGGADDDASWAGEALKFPRIQGIDACGRIEAVGAGVDAGRIGERVLEEPCLLEALGKVLDLPWFLGSECDGGFAQYLCVAARHAWPVDSPLSDAELATFPCSYSTAENLLTRARVAEGQTVLITGASGGVGSAAVQLAGARGATVVAVTRPEKAEGLRALGAETTVGRDDDPRDAAPDGYDAVIDLVGGPAMPGLLEAIRPFGHYAVAGAVAGAIVPVDLRTVYLSDLTLVGCTVLAPEVFPNLVAHIEAGRIRPLVAETYPLTEIAAAQEEFAAKSLIGKIALTVP